ncbi:divisome protein SepX/GlpR [Streptomonospora wellingtoniae]|uniref:Uncharacterized protein n=1 Tax=Streptomonospora wellingtoniae TaxID=3075544 RepID=A0ABU2KV24_9ACTN|nr:hypothetical protein [Streptomonospora sp. DSM 45055]MDT0303154.1 hypothetical protein [Streptomonospora sp. DSM 45055]
MSSSPLYLAIVVVWLIVLVPMLLRRDSAAPYEDDADFDGDLHDGEDADHDGDAEDGRAPYAAESAEEEPEYDGSRGAPAAPVRERDEPADPDETRVMASYGAEKPEDEEAAMESGAPAPRPRPSRAGVIARRRRRTSGLTALLALAGIGVATGLGPWWVLAPPTVLLLGHLALLREAAKADAERRAAEVRRRRRATEIRRAREAAEAAREAQVIELMNRRKEVYDQYTDAHQRAAGD